MKKSRKKMLLSSIAMLLVALVALGSATFAWYYTQNTVNANAAKFGATSATGLEIKHKVGGTWEQSIDFDTAASALPNASTNFSTSSGSLIGAKGGEGKSVDDGELNSDLTYVADCKADAAFYYDDAYVASSGEPCTAYTKVSVNGSDDTYLIFLVYANGSLVGAFSTDTKTGAPTSTTKIKQDTVQTKAVADGTYSPLKVGSGDYSGTDLVSASFTAKTKTSGGTHIEVYGFVDGFNPKCTTNTYNTTECDIDLAFSTSAWS